MIRKALLALATLVVVLSAFASIMYVSNATPTAPPISAAAAANPAKPYVVKLHAQWCPVCMATKTVWSQIEAAYASRVHLVVLDFTNQATTDASAAEAKRLGLQSFYDDNAGWTGTIAVVDARSREALAVIHGSRDFAEYRTAIDAALNGSTK